MSYFEIYSYFKSNFLAEGKIFLSEFIFLVLRKHADIFLFENIFFSISLRDLQCRSHTHKVVSYMRDSTVFAIVPRDVVRFASKFVRSFRL